jgi:hypothetical protein
MHWLGDKVLDSLRYEHMKSQLVVESRNTYVNPFNVDSHITKKELISQIVNTSRTVY